MEENKGLEMGVEETSVANLEPEEVTNEQDVVVEEQPDKEVVEHAVEPVETKFEKAFSKRLSKAQEKIRQDDVSVNVKSAGFLSNKKRDKK